MNDIRTDWTRDEIDVLFDLPFHELMWRAQPAHRDYHPAGEVQALCFMAGPTVFSPAISC